MADVGGMTGLGKGLLDLVLLAEREGWLDRLKTIFKKRNRIIVLGATGVGKTNLLESLSVLMPEAIRFLDRTHVGQQLRLQIQETPFKFLDTPGQLAYREERKKSIREEMAQGKLGVLNVVSYGYHESASPDLSEVFEGDEVRGDYLTRQREIEIADARDWSTLLLDRASAFFLITAVSKADLWWDLRKDVIEYYQAGSYAQDILQGVDMPHYVVPYCSVMHKFYGRGRLSGDFDDDTRVTVRSGLLREIVDATRKHAD